MKPRLERPPMRQETIPPLSAEEQAQVDQLYADYTKAATRVSELTKQKEEQGEGVWSAENELLLQEAIRTLDEIVEKASSSLTDLQKRHINSLLAGTPGIEHHRVTSNENLAYSNGPLEEGE